MGTSDYFFLATKQGEGAFETYMGRKEVLRRAPVYTAAGWRVILKKHVPGVGYVGCTLEEVKEEPK